MSRQEILFRAALTRFVLGAAALVLVPLLYPEMREARWVFGLYLAMAAVEQVLIRQQIGGMIRSLGAGFVDMAIISFLVHALGSATTIFASLYLFAGFLNAMVVGRRVGVALSVLNAIAFAAIVWAEHFHLLAFAPDNPEVALLGPPSFGLALAVSILMAIFLVSSTTIVGMLVTQLHSRERELLVANAQLANLSVQDPLTLLYNRRYLYSQLEREIERARRGHPLCALMIDLDGFKRVNDLRGHARGDALLQSIAHALEATTRASDVTGRYGGDEFVVILPDTDSVAAQAVAERIADAVREVGESAGDDKPVTASVGIAAAQPIDDVASLLNRADENAYRAKQSGGNRVAA